MFFWNILFIIFLFCLALYSYISRKQELFEKSGIPCIKPWPIIGNMGPIIMQKMSFGQLLEKIYFMNTKAKYVGFFEFSTPVIMIRDPEIIKSIGTKNYEIFYNRRGFAEEDHNLILGQDISSLKDEKWRHMRNILSPSFTSGKFKQFYNLTAKKTQDALEYIHNQNEMETEMKILFQKLAIDIMFAYAFGISTNFIRDEGVEQLAEDLNGINPEKVEKLKLFLIQCPFIFKILGLKYLSDKARNYFQNIVQFRMNERDGEKNFKSNMIDMMIDTPDNVEKLSINEMTAQVFIMFAGAFLTTSDTLSYLCYNIAINTEVQIKLQQEIDSLSYKYKTLNDETLLSNQENKISHNVTFEEIMNLKYLDAVIKESLRLHTTIVALERVCSQSFQLPPALPGLKPFTLKPGTILSIPIESIHRDSKYFKEPEKFNPNRFFNVNEKNILNSYTYLPFGVGPRHCIANRFSIQALKIIIFYILANCNLQVCSKTPIPLKMNRRKLTKAPDKSIILQIEKRINCNANE
ncbi:cytochrome P450 9e2-like [Leptopilina boulardi]|uniref:cytochrome P450 9e2-like n=1 Tax=Leptopilina boulardi TaxID=63433 RepID=UPI0021F5736E|nr:cytochrome P450 9e2-like [Leptopilina boulardi]